MEEKQIEEEIRLNLNEQNIGLWELIDFLFGGEFEEYYNKMKGGKK